MHHQALQSDFQPPYFPPPFHHATQSPPQQQNHGPLEYLSADPYGQPLSSLHHAPLHHYNQLTGLRPTQDQLGIHRTHREAELQGHAVSVAVIHCGRCDIWLFTNSKITKYENNKKLTIQMSDEQHKNDENNNKSSGVECPV